MQKLFFLLRSNATYVKRISTLWFHLEPLYRLSKLYKDELKYKLESFYENVMATKADDWKECKPYTKNNVELAMNVFLKEENNFSHEEIRDSMKGLVFAVRIINN